MKPRTYRFIRDELITLSPALAAAVLIAIIGLVIPRDLVLFISVLLVLSITAALASQLPPVRAARARLARSCSIPAPDGF